MRGRRRGRRGDPNVNPRFAITSLRLATLTLLAALAGCSTVKGWFASDDESGVDTQPQRPQSLIVPPDLSQLSRDSRYAVQGGVVSASEAGASAPAAAVATGAPTVAINSEGGMHIERDGQARWLVVPQSPETLWPQVKAFWERRGYKLSVDDPKLGVMDTEWHEDKSKAPLGTVRKLLGGVLDNAVDTGLRDAYRTRIERTAKGSEIYISQRGIREVFVNDQHDETAWRPRPNDPQLEAEMLARLMLALGGPGAGANAAAAAGPAAAASAATVTQAPLARMADPAQQPTTLTLDEPFDRAWRRVGLALDRGGFTVEDRDRTAGLYFVRWVDPKNVNKEQPGWWARLFGDHSNPQAALRFRIALKPSADQTTVAVQNSTGQVDTGDNARRIADLLLQDLR
ncbi:MAG: outer membrane protein assembly factor BamC [Burkholderiales bacterium]|nr:outer membrane protein assembly factor BamC [Burkholderiales bacterium]